MAFNEEETRFHLIDPVLRRKGYNDPQRIRLETPAPVEPTGPKGRRRKGAGRTDYLLCVQVGDMPKPLPVAVLEAKRSDADPLKGMEQAKGYADCTRFDVQYVFASNGHLYGDYDKPSGLQTGPHPLDDFPPHSDLCARYAKDKGISLTSPDAALLFQADSPAWSQTRYYQDTAIRAAFEKIILQRQADEAHAGQPFPSYARQLAQRGNRRGDSRWSWAVDFAARRAKAREDMQPLLDGVAALKAEVVDIKEQGKRLKKDKADGEVLDALDAKIREKGKAARDLEAQAAAIDAAVFDLKAVNPNAVAAVDGRTPAEIIASIDAQGRIVAQALGRLRTLLDAEPAMAHK